jgi:hypothetical protein
MLVKLNLETHLGDCDQEIPLAVPNGKTEERLYECPGGSLPIFGHNENSIIDQDQCSYKCVDSWEMILHLYAVHHDVTPESEKLQHENKWL